MHYYAKSEGNCKGVENLREEQSTSGNKSIANLHSNIVGKKDCENSVWTPSSFENSSMELDKEVWREITNFREKTEKSNSNRWNCCKKQEKRSTTFILLLTLRNELILMRVYTTRNYLTTKSFIKEVLECCENKPKFIIDKAPWLIYALKSLNLEFEYHSFWKKLGWICVFFSKAED